MIKLSSVPYFEEMTSLKQLGLTMQDRPRVAAIIETGRGILLGKDRKDPWKEERSNKLTSELGAIRKEQVINQNRIASALARGHILDAGVLEAENLKSEKRTNRLLSAIPLANKLITEGIFSLPGGKIDNQDEADHLELAIAREIGEELGLVVKDLKYFRSYPAKRTGGRSHVIFVAKTEGEVKIDNTELNGIGLLNKHEIIPFPGDYFYQRHARLVFEDYFSSPAIRHSVINDNLISNISLNGDLMHQWFKDERIGYAFHKAKTEKNPAVGAETISLWLDAAETYAQSSSFTTEMMQKVIHNLRSNLQQVLKRNSISKLPPSGIIFGKRYPADFTAFYPPWHSATPPLKLSDTIPPRPEISDLNLKDSAERKVTPDIQMILDQFMPGKVIRKA